MTTAQIHEVENQVLALVDRLTLLIAEIAAERAACGGQLSPPNEDHYGTLMVNLHALRRRIDRIV